MTNKGWILFTEAVGMDPTDKSGKDFSPWADKGYGLIVRINHAYNPNGTLPYESHYSDFASRVANFVAHSSGAHIWIIGNETNLQVEWPKYEKREETITPKMYAACFKLCRNKIRALESHSKDQVVMQGIAPWAETKGVGSLDYYKQALDSIGNGNVDGIALHTYTHGSDPALIESEAIMDVPHQNCNFNFRSYRDFLKVNPDWAKSIPVYITETDQFEAWLDKNNGWVKKAYSEINDWNKGAANQKIRALVLYRWPEYDMWSFANKKGVIEDLEEASRNEYRWK